MIEVADIVRRFGPSYLNAHGASLLPSHRRALFDIEACRTEYFGGHLWHCEACDAEIHSYHGCGNRSCPKCHRAQTEAWLEARTQEMLPTHHFHVTVTVPEELRRVFRGHQRLCYGLLMRATAQAIIEMGWDQRYVGGQVGVLAVLHTWTRTLTYHPHVHCLVTGGGVSEDGAAWNPNVRDGFLFPVMALAKIVRHKFRKALAKELPGVALPRGTWRKRWVVHCVPWGKGQQAVLSYLARYVFRTAITNSRVIAVNETSVVFQYKARDETEKQGGKTRTCTVSGHEFLRRFCQHVLPKGFHKVRYYGLWHPSKRKVADRVRTALALDDPSALLPDTTATLDATATEDHHKQAGGPRACPRCGHAPLILLRTIPRPRSREPFTESPVNSP